MLHTPIGMGNTACVAAAPYQVMARTNKHPQDDGGTQTLLEYQQKRWVDTLTFSDRLQSSLSILLLVHYKSGDTKGNVGMCIVGCLLFASFRSIHASQTEVESSLPNRHSLFLSSISCLSLPHSYHSIYIGLIVTEHSSVFNLGCTEPVQHNHIHSIH